MARSNPIRAAARYNGKYTGDVYRNTPDVKAMGQDHGRAAAMNKQIDAKITAAMNTQIHMTPILQSYRSTILAYMRKMAKIIRTHSGPTTIAELTAIEQVAINPPDFTAAQLRAMVLEAFGVTYP